MSPCAGVVPRIFSEERNLTLGYTPSAHWTVLSFPVGSHPQSRGTTSKLRFDLFTARRLLKSR